MHVHIHIHSCMEALTNIAEKKTPCRIAKMLLHFQKKKFDAILVQIILIQFERISCIIFSASLQRKSNELWFFFVSADFCCLVYFCPEPSFRYSTNVMVHNRNAVVLLRSFCVFFSLLIVVFISTIVFVAVMICGALCRLFFSRSIRLSFFITLIFFCVILCALPFIVSIIYDCFISH